MLERQPTLQGLESLNEVTFALVLIWTVMGLLIKDLDKYLPFPISKLQFYQKLSESPIFDINFQLITFTVGNFQTRYANSTLFDFKQTTQLKKGFSKTITNTIEKWNISLVVILFNCENKFVSVAIFKN